jgi:hypothetical protein
MTENIFEAAGIYISAIGIGVLFLCALYKLCKWVDGEMG